MEESENETQFDVFPKYYELLSKEDQAMYVSLRNGLSSHACRNRRGKRLETFSEMMNTIKQYCIRSSDSDWKRCLVCGVCWLPTGIAVNTRHLSLLTDKCKSSINGSLQKMGYNTVQCRTEYSQPLIDQIPILKNNFNELREWTIRQYIAHTPTPTIPFDPTQMYSAMMQSPMPAFYSPMPQMNMNMMPFMSPDPSSFQQLFNMQMMQQNLQQQKQFNQQQQFLRQLHLKQKKQKHSYKPPAQKANPISNTQQQETQQFLNQQEQQNQQQQQQQQQENMFQQVPQLQQVKEEKKDPMDVPLEPFSTAQHQEIASTASFFEGDPLSLTPSFLYDVDFFDDNQ